jgi:putative pyruvate formate lyase activating enzyme
MYPSYLGLYRTSELAARAKAAVAALADCALCARRCHADRSEESPGKSFCRTGRHARVSSAFPHHGEEPCLRGRHGSGTIFFGDCNLRCVFCQNYELSWLGQGRAAGPDELARLMLGLQEHGCHNINLVTPSHVVAQVLEALVEAVGRGLSIPIVYNTGGYDRVETLRMLDGVVDIYMPDFKFWDPQVARQLAAAEDYREVACLAIQEMHRQVGDLELDESGIARRGLLVRHLVMPNGQAGTREVMRFLAREVSRNTYVNIMAQYRPEHQAAAHPQIDRRPLPSEYREAVSIAEEEGLWRFDRR